MSAQNALGPSHGGNASMLNIIAPTIIQASPGTLFTLNVLIAGSSFGAVYDSNILTGLTIAKQVAVIPNAITTEPLSYTWPCAAGIVIVPGNGQTLSIAATGPILQSHEGLGATIQDHQYIAGIGAAAGP